MQISLPNFIEDAFKKSINPSAFFFFHKNIGTNNSLTLIENNTRFEIMKFEFQVTVHFSPWAKYTQLWPLKPIAIFQEKVVSSYLVLLFIWNGDCCFWISFLKYINCFALFWFFVLFLFVLFWVSLPSPFLLINWLTAHWSRPLRMESYLLKIVMQLHVRFYCT